MKKYIIMRERSGALAPSYWNLIIQTGDAVKKIYDKKLSKSMILYSNKKIIQVILEKDFIQISNHITKKVIENKKYFKNIENKTNIAKFKILSFIEKTDYKNLSKTSFKKLVNLINKIYSLFLEYDAASIFIWFLSDENLKQKIRLILNISEEELNIITIPKEKTFVTKMNLDILKFSMKSKKTENIKKYSKILEKNYNWIPFGYDGHKCLDKNYFFKEIKKKQANIKKCKHELNKIEINNINIKKEKEKILKKIKNGKDNKRLITILQKITQWTDERKMLDFKLFIYYHKILHELENSYKIPMKNLKHLFIEEIAQLENNTNKIKKISQKRISQKFLIIGKDGTCKIRPKSEYCKIMKIIKETNKTLSIIKGSAANKGPQIKYIANVKILNSTNEHKKIKHGEILVTPMTTPDYISAMNLAMGFITDEGGITCHAAIIAREMNKPCIIGTKNATKNLKDGDKIEMNMIDGTIKVLK